MIINFVTHNKFCFDLFSSVAVGIDVSINGITTITFDTNGMAMNTIELNATMDSFLEGREFFYTTITNVAPYFDGITLPMSTFAIEDLEGK